MQVKSLKIFCDIAARRSFSRAAEDNDLTQSGASQIVHHLEDELGVKLIDRSKRPISLTPEGNLFYDGCRELIRGYLRLESSIRGMHKDLEGRVRVAAIYSVGFSHIEQIKQQFHDCFPRCKVCLEYHHPDEVYELVSNDQADLGLVSYPKKSKKIDVTLWREESLVIACSPRSRFAVEESMNLRDLDGQEMIGFTPELRIRRRIDQELAAVGSRPEVTLEFDNIESIKRAVEADAGFSLLPMPTLIREIDSGSLKAIPLGKPLVRPLGIIRRHGHSLPTAAQKFFEMLTSEIPSEGKD